MHSTADKSPEAFRTISEVAGELDVPQHVLRFWEAKFGAVRPLKRGSGRRYYRPDDIDLLRGIRSLLYNDGLTIKGVQKLLRERGARYVTGLGRESISHLQAVHAKVEPPKHHGENHDAHHGEHRAAQESIEHGSNIRPFPLNSRNRLVETGEAGEPVEQAEVGLTGAERSYFGNILDELIELKDRLGSTRRNIGQI